MAKGGTIEYGVRFNVDQSSLSTIRTELNRISHEIKEMAKDPETLVSKETITNVEKLQHALNQSWNSKLNQLNLTRFQSEIQKSKISMTQLRDTFLEIGKFGTFNNLTSNLLTTNAQLKVTNDWMERIATSFGNVARYALSSKIFNNFVNSISQAYKFTVDLDSALNSIRIVSGQSAEQMDSFAVSANKASKALGASTLEYAKGALIYYQQGLSAEEVNKRTEITLKMANVLGASAQEVSNYMTAIWNNFDHGTDTLEHYADVITALGAATASSSEEIATGLEKFAAVANTIGLSYEYATTALATVVAQTRQSADTVGTAFRTIFARMEDLKLGKTLDDGTTLGKYSSALAKIGVSIKDQNGQLKDMDTILSEMGEKWQTLSKDQQVAVAQGVAGIRQYTQLTALMDNWDKFTQNLTVAQGSAGTLQKQQDIYMESFEAHLQKLSTEAERTYSILFDADSAKDFIDVITAGFTKINDVLENMGGGLNTFINLLSQVGTIFSKQIGTEVVRVWNNAKTSFMGQKQKEAFVNDVIQTYQEPNKTGLEKIYGKNDLTDKAVEQQAKNIKDILNVSSGLTSETQEQVVKEQQKIAILDVEIEKREKVLNLAKKHKILTSEQAEEWKNKAAEHGYAGAVNQYGQIEKALKEKETGVDAQQRQEYADLNQNREDIVREGKQNQDIAKTTRTVFATVQAVNALTSAIKILSDQSATTQQKVSGVAQSVISGIGAAVSAFNPLVGILIQIGGSLLGSIITDIIDFRSEQEKLADTVKETQKAFEDASNAYQELKGTLSNYESAKKGLEGLEQGTIDFYEAIIKTNEQAQQLIDKLHLVAGLDYSIDATTGLLKINEDSLDNAMLKEQQKVFRSQITNFQAQYDLKASQRNAIVNQASEATTTKDGYRISSQTMEDILSKAIEKTELSAEDRFGQLYKTSEGVIERDVVNPFVKGTQDLTEETKEITKEVSQYRGEYNKVSAEMLALQKQIAYATIQAYGTQEQLETYRGSTTKTKELLAAGINEIDSEVLQNNKDNAEDFYTYWTLRTFNANKKNREVAQRLGFSPEELNQIEGFENDREDQAFYTEESYWKALYAYDQGYRYNAETESWTRPGGQPVVDAEEEIFGVDKNLAKDYLVNQRPRANQMNIMFEELNRVNNAVNRYYRNQDVSQETRNYTSEAVFAGQRKDTTYDYSILNQQEAEAARQILSSGGIELSSDQQAQLQQAIEGIQNTIGRARKDLSEYNDAMEQNATSLGTSTEALKIYDAALQNSNAQTVEYNKTLADLAAANYKFNKSFNEGRKTFESNKDAWNTYVKALKNGKSVSYDVADGAGEIVKSLKDMDLTLKTEDLKNPEALKNIEKLLSGTEKEAEAAYKELEKLSLLNLLNDNFVNQFEKAEESITDFVNYISELDPGQTLDEKWSQHLVKMIDSSQMTLEEVQNLFANAHIQMPDVDDYELTEASAKSGATKTKHTYDGQIPTGKVVGGEAEYIPVHYEWYETTEPVEQKYFKFKNQNVTLKKDSSGGSRNFSTSSPKSSKGKSGGSSNKSKQVDPIQEQADRYHEVNTQITKVENSLKKLQSQQSKFVGNKLIENLNKQWTLLNTQVENYQEKLRIANGEMQELAEKLAGKGVKFNADGTIGNYMEAFYAQEDVVNNLIAQYNKLSKAQQEVWDNKKTIENAKETFNQFKTNLNRYDELVSSVIPGLQQNILDTVDKQIELNIKKFNLEITVTLDMTQAERDWNAWKKRALEGIEPSDIYGNANARLQDFYTYFNAAGTGETQVGTRHLNDLLEELHRMDENTEGVYGDTAGNRAKALEDLKTYYTQLMQSITDVIELQDELHQSLLSEMDEIQDKFNEQIESYEYLSEVINHDLKVVQMIYGEDAYDTMDKFYDMQHENYIQELDFYRQQRDFWQNAMERAEEGTEEWEKAKESMLAAKQGMEQTLVAGLENAKTDLENAIGGIFKRLNNLITKGMGLDYVNEQWELINKNADRYLDTINKTFGIRQLEQKYIDAINKTNNITVQQQLQKVMNEQLDNLKQRDRLTQYDLDRANKLYEIELARIALQEAQMNKSQMRLRRDSQGNYTYQYVANRTAIDDAQAQLNDLYNSLYNFDRERYNSVLNDAYSSWVEYQQKMAEAALITDPELRAQKELLIQQEYNEYMTQIEEDYQVSRYNLQESAFDDLKYLHGRTYEEMSDYERLIVMDEIVPTWNNGIQQMIEQFSGEGGFAELTKTSWKEMLDAQDQYAVKTQELETTSGQTYKVIADGLDKAIKLSKDFITNNDDLITKYDIELDKVWKVYDAVKALREEFQSQATAANKAAEAAYNYYKKELELQQAQAKAAEATRNKTVNPTTDAKNVTTYDSKNSATGGSGKSNGGGSSGGGGGGGTTTKPTATSVKATYTIMYYAKTSTGGNACVKTVKVTEGNTYQVNYSPSSVSGYRFTGVFKTSSGKELRNGDSFKVTKNETLTAQYQQIASTKPNTGLVGIAIGAASALLPFASGGYTGSWENNSGRLAVLHQKELVLNEADTKNMLNTVAIMRQISSSLGENTLARLAGATAQGYTSSSDGGLFEQNVHIDATFPNVQNSREIEEALNNLVNSASQRVMENKRR